MSAFDLYKDDPHTRSIPANVDAESAFLGSLLIDPSKIILVNSYLKPADMYRERHESICSAIYKIHASGGSVDFITVTEQLEVDGKLEFVGGPGALMELVTDTPTSMYVEDYAKIIKDNAVRRKLISSAGVIAEAAYSAQNADEAVGIAHGELTKVDSSRPVKNVKKAITVAYDVLGDIDEILRSGKPLGLMTGLTMLDRMLGGLQASDLVILAGRPGSGKTATALTMARNIAKKVKERVLFFSLEMSEKQLLQRVMAMESGVDSHKIKTGNLCDDEVSKLGYAVNQMDYDLLIDDTPSTTLSYIRSESKRIHAESPIGVIIVDYLQLVTTDEKFDTRALQVSHIGRMLKALARELNVPVLALSQFSRNIEGRSDKRPMLSDLAEGSIEKDADVVLAAHRDDYYDDDAEKQNIMDIIVLKHRHGATGIASFYFKKELTEIKDLEIQRTEFE